MPDDAALRLLLLRHGDVHGLRRRGVRGQADVPLSTEGRRQHAVLVEQLRDHEQPPQLVLCSDLSRCHDLGTRLAQSSGAELVVDARLREQHMGAWEGLT